MPPSPDLTRRLIAGHSKIASRSEGRRGRSHAVWHSVTRGRGGGDRYSHGERLVWCSCQTVCRINIRHTVWHEHIRRPAYKIDRLSDSLWGWKTPKILDPRIIRLPHCRILPCTRRKSAILCNHYLLSSSCLRLTYSNLSSPLTSICLQPVFWELHGCSALSVVLRHSATFFQSSWSFLCCSSFQFTFQYLKCTVSSWASGNMTCKSHFLFLNTCV